MAEALRKNKTLSLDEAAHLLLTGRTEMMVLTDADKEYLLQRFLEISSQPKQRYGRTDARILDDTKHLMLDKGLGLIPGFHLNPHYEKRGFMPDDPLTQVPDGIHTATGTQIECKKLGDNSDNLGFYSERWNHIFDNPQLVDYFALARTLATPDGDRYFYKFVCVFPRNVLINPLNNQPMRPYAKAEMTAAGPKWTFLMGEAERAGVCAVLPENQRGPIRV